jgi:beta-N-acetylhexosaminidase
MGKFTVTGIGLALCLVALLLPGKAWPGAERPPVEAIVNTFTLPRKVAQLFMIGCNGVALRPSLARLLTDIPVGGIILYNHNMRKGPGQVRAFTAALSLHARNNPPAIPLMIATDLEGGVVKRIERNFSSVPAAKDLGAIDDPETIERLSALLGSQLLAYGINMNLAPVLEIDAQVLGSRVFAGQAAVVARAGTAYIKGMQKAGVIATGKHFPAVGPRDPHQAFGVIKRRLPELRVVEFGPFREAIANQVGAIMPAFAYLEGMGAGPQLIPTTAELMTGLLKEDMRFAGVVISDDLLMADQAHKPVLLQTHSLAEAVVKLVLAGVDMVLISDASLLRQAHAALVAAVVNGEIPLARINDAVSRIITVKQGFGLFDSDYPQRCEVLYERLPALTQAFDTLYESTKGQGRAAQ